MNWIEELYTLKPKKLFAQNGEETYLNHIFKNIGTTNKVLVDIGSGDGVYLSNSLALRNKGWNGLLIDGKENNSPLVYQKSVTVENICDILFYKKIPKEFDLLSLDTDGNDFWLISEILKSYYPRVIIAEFNSSFTESKTIKYDADFFWEGDDYFGFTFEAGQKLAEQFGYKIIFQNNDMNLYFVKADLIGELEIPKITYTVNDYFKKSERTDWVII